MALNKRDKDVARRFFDPLLTDSERAAFEAGIALATLLHQFQGMPLPRKPRDVRLVEKIIEESLKAQPFRKRAAIRLKRVRTKASPYGYATITPQNIEALIEIKYGSAELVAAMKWIEKLNYPLMFIKSIKRL